MRFVTGPDFTCCGRLLFADVKSGVPPSPLIPINKDFSSKHPRGVPIIRGAPFRVRQTSYPQRAGLPQIQTAHAENFSVAPITHFTAMCFGDQVRNGSLAERGLWERIKHYCVRPVEPKEVTGVLFPSSPTRRRFNGIVSVMAMLRQEIGNSATPSKADCAMAP